MSSDLEQLLAERAYRCRLTPDRALEAFDDAVAFLAERTMLTRTPDCALPSLFEACHEEPYRPGGHGFAAWPKTKYVWAGELEERAECLVLNIHRGKHLMLSGAAIDAAAPICLAELERMEDADPGWRRLLRHLDQAGPSVLADLQTELGLKPKELRALRSPLERCGALVARQVVFATPAGCGEGDEGDVGHVHTSELARFDQVYTKTPPARNAAESLADLVVAGLRAAVVAPEAETAKWFSWRWRFDSELVDRLVSDGRVIRLAEGLVAPADSAIREDVS